MYNNSNTKLIALPSTYSYPATRILVHGLDQTHQSLINFSSDSFCQICRVADEALTVETMVWPNFFLTNVFFALKETSFFVIISSLRIIQHMTFISPGRQRPYREVCWQPSASSVADVQQNCISNSTARQT